MVISTCITVYGNTRFLWNDTTQDLKSTDDFVMDHDDLVSNSAYTLAI